MFIAAALMVMLGVALLSELEFGSKGSIVAGISVVAGMDMIVLPQLHFDAWWKIAIFIVLSPLLIAVAGSFAHETKQWGRGR